MVSEPSVFEKLLSQTGVAELFSPAKTVPAMRDAMARMRDLVEVEAPPVAGVETVELPGGDGQRTARIYTPHGVPETPGPGLIFFHGGGFVVGSLDSHDRLCRRLAAASTVRICAVDYRLAPEHPFPAAVDDAFAAFDAALEGALEPYGFDPEQLAVGGDSAGGNLAASIARERRRRVRFQLLFYPLLQMVQLKKDRPRWQEGPLLSTRTLEEIKKHYIVDADPADLRISPLLADELGGLPPAYFTVAELDPLLDEGEAYSQRLGAWGVPVERKVWRGAPHGFLNMSRMIPACIPATEHAARALSRALTV